MKILVINCGSSSLRYQLIDMDNEKILAKGKCDKIGLAGSFIEYECPTKNIDLEELVDIKNHNDAMGLVIEKLTNDKIGAIDNIRKIGATGHRVVSGGEKLKESTLVTDEVIDEIEKCIDLAPLHNPGHLMGIRACKEILPDVPMVVVFDTAFHQTMPKEAFLYPLPYEYYEKHRVRKYGAHGISHRYITLKTAEVLEKDINEINIISCHLGNGASICAIKNGESIDTSMGLTPLEGLMMGTRTGDIDPAIAKYILDHENITIDEFNEIINKKSGLLGISGITSDFRELKRLKDEGNQKAKLALDMQMYRIKKYIGSYLAILGRVDAITFEGGIGENNIDIIYQILEGMEELGIVINKKVTHKKGEIQDLTGLNSKTKILKIPTNEELMIARDTLEIVKKNNIKL